TPTSFSMNSKSMDFRALLHLENGRGELVSRNGNTFRGFAELATWLAENLKVESAVIDGEIACIDGDGRPIFRDLLFRKSECISSPSIALPERKGSANAAPHRAEATTPKAPPAETFTNSVPGSCRE